MGSPTMSHSCRSTTEGGVLQTLEFQLVAACSFLDQHSSTAQNATVLRLLDQGPDLERFLRLTKRHRVQRLAYEVLRRATSQSGRDVSWITEKLLPLARRVQFQSLSLHAEWLRLQDVFHQEQIPIHSLKGTALSQRLYADVAMRHCRDLDILVAPEDVEPACELLTQSGYSVRQVLPPHRRYGYQLRVCRLLEWHIACEGPGNNSFVELHWRLEQLTFSGLNAVWARILAEVSAGTRPWAHFDLLYCCMHGASHAWMRLKWLGDVRILAGRIPPDEWPAILSLARELRMEEILSQALLLMQDILGFPVPVPSASVVQHHFHVAAKLAAEADQWLSLPEEDLAEDAVLSRMRARKRRSHLHFRHSVWERSLFRAATSLFSLSDLQKYGLPAWLLPLYPIIRPLSVCGRVVTEAMNRQG